MRLWIKVDNQHTPAFLGKGGGEIHGRGCFTAAPLLIRDHYRFHISPGHSSHGQCNDSLPVIRWQLASKGQTSPSQ